MNNDADSAGKRFAGKTIPDFFGSLPSLEGLFLGEFIYLVIFYEFHQNDYYGNNER